MTKAKRKKKRKKGIHVPRPIFILIILISIVVAIYITLSLTNTPSSDGELKAAILDSLYVMDPNQDFLNRVNQTLTSAGYKVDIYLGEYVSVELFKNLPSLGYKFIVLRVHTAYDPDLVVFFTGSYADSEYFYERMLGWVRIGDAWGQHFYAITPRLIKEATGRVMFQDSIIIIDSCFGLNSTSMAQAFIEKGASTYIAWDQGVYSYYSDEATLILIENLLEGMTIKEAIDETPKDPDLGSILSHYPISGGENKLHED